MKTRADKVYLFILVMLLPLTGCNKQGTWISLMDGKTLSGWETADQSDDWTVNEGVLSTTEAGKALFYTGKMPHQGFKNFILEMEVETSPSADAGVYFHTGEGSDLPVQGYEARICNDPEVSVGRIMTGSLTGIRNQCKPPVKDGEWFDYRMAVQGKTIRTWVNDQPIADYTEPSNPYRSRETRGCVLKSGTIALVNYHQGSRISFRNIRIKPLKADLPTPGEPLADSAFAARLIRMSARHIPLYDLHIHLKEGLTMDQALEHARKYGFTYGIAFNGGLKMYIETDDSLGKFLDAYRQPPQTWLAMQAEGREWLNIFSPENIHRFGYVFTDAMTWTNNNGKRMRLWIKEETEVGDPDDFMDQLVDRIVGIVSNEPINIYVNATYLPDEIAPQYDALWTPERMDRVIHALVEHHVAMEISARFRIPSARFIQRAKAAGVKFTFGTNNTGPDDLGRLEYCLDMVDACHLTFNDFWFPPD